MLRIFVEMKTEALMLSQALLGIPLHERQDELLTPRGAPGRWQRGRHDVAEERVAVAAVVGRLALHELIEQHPEAVEVHGPAVALARQDLGRQVGHGAAEGLGAVERVDALLREAEVRQDAVALLFQHHVPEKLACRD